MAAMALSSSSNFTLIDMDPVRLYLLRASLPQTTDIFCSPSAQTPPTDYYSFILDVLKRSKSQPSTTSPVPTPLINQAVLRHCLGLASSFLVTDLSTSPEKGLTTWLTGFGSLVDITIALHARGELEVETLSEASKACSECWTAAGTWRGMENCRDGVRTIGEKLKKLLDDGGRTYRGELVYAP